MAQMTQVVENPQVVTGVWKFHKSVPPEVLVALAMEWRAAQPGYTQLHVRESAKDQRAIGFQYTLPRPGKKAYDKFFHAHRDQLRRRFGDEFVGWDVGNPTIIILQ
ncbi:hypothetical protein K8Q93_02970 [Candidatus Parcubacteria bacterium]|nr:hypothetical protein [Candidatus Parcubacteria bacterium]